MVRSHFAKETGRGTVGINTRRREQADDTIGVHQPGNPLDEQAVQVGVATTQQGIVTAGPPEPEHGVGLGECVHVAAVEWVVVGFQLGNQLLASGRRRSFGNIWPAGFRSEPLHFLQFHDFPRRVADYGVKAASPRLPSVEYAGEGQFPMERPPFLCQFLDIQPQPYETGEPGVVEVGRLPIRLGKGAGSLLQQAQLGIIVLRQPPLNAGGVVVADLPAELPGLAQGQRAAAVAGGHPAQAGEEVQHPAHPGRRFPAYCGTVPPTL